MAAAGKSKFVNKRNREEITNNILIILLNKEF
ncbi:Uncharacterised protein [uncultured archaeon]|nr:Uncharacterised protein [uncultured archaeon]